MTLKWNICQHHDQQDSSSDIINILCIISTQHIQDEDWLVSFLDRILSNITSLHFQKRFKNVLEQKGYINMTHRGRPFQWSPCPWKWQISSQERATPLKSFLRIMNLSWPSMYRGICSCSPYTIIMQRQL